MGFCSSVALAQHIHRTIVGQAVQECVRRVGFHVGEAERRTGGSHTAIPATASILDTFDRLEKMDHVTAEKVRGSCPPLFEALRSAYDRHAPASQEGGSAWSWR